MEIAHEKDKVNRKREFFLKEKANFPENEKPFSGPQSWKVHPYLHHSLNRV